jgi:hypothetical protein
MAKISGGEESSIFKEIFLSPPPPAFIRLNNPWNEFDCSALYKKLFAIPNPEPIFIAQFETQGDNAVMPPAIVCVVP